jgi:hypothetical protein
MKVIESVEIFFTTSKLRVHIDTHGKDSYRKQKEAD